MVTQNQKLTRRDAKSSSKAEQLAQEIAKHIVANQLAEGSLLASENELSSTYDMSRPQTRQALQRLAAAGLIETRHGLGSQVNPKHRWNLFDPILLDAFIQSNNLIAIADELIELRKMVELQCSRLAAQRMSSLELGELDQWLKRMDYHLNDTEAITEADILFHKTIVNASRNRFLQGILSYLHPVLEKARLLAFETVERQGRLEIQKQHKAIFDAIATGDAERAESAMREHMKQHEKDMRNALLLVDLKTTHLKIGV